VASVSCRAAYINVQQRALTKRQWLCCKVLAEQSGTQYTLDDIEQSRQSRYVRAWLPFAKPARSGGAPKPATEPMQSASRRDSIVSRIFSGRLFTSSVVGHHRSGIGHGAPRRVAGDALASERRRVAVLSQRVCANDRIQYRAKGSREQLQARGHWLRKSKLAYCVENVGNTDLVFPEYLERTPFLAQTWPAAELLLRRAMSRLLQPASGKGFARPHIPCVGVGRSSKRDGRSVEAVDVVAQARATERQDTGHLRTPWI
jgi:hypothetical protein